MPAPRLFGFLVACALAQAPATADESPVTLAGTVRLPDGSPAAGAVVESTHGGNESATAARADGAGRFRLADVFPTGARLHARSADGAHQATRFVASVAVRTAAATPIDLILEPASAHEVMVVADGRPVAGARVVASGPAFEVQGVTGADGTARLLFPAKGRPRELVAWHPERGVRGVKIPERGPAPGSTRLALLPPGPLTVRVVNPDDKPVRGVEIVVNVQADGSEWAALGTIDAARVRTDADGRAAVPWAPRERLKFVDPVLNGSDWRVEKVDLDRLGDRLVTVHARRTVPVEGRLVAPKGESPAGVLVTGFGFGPANNGDIPSARARADGSFTLRVVPGYGYVLGIADLRYAGELWSGLVLSRETSEPADLTIFAERATPVTVRVTRGPRNTPVADAWVEAGSTGHVNWVDSTGKRRSGRAGIRSWLRTDRDGRATTGAGRGPLAVRLDAGDWDEEKTVAVASETPVAVEFHRAWEGDRRVAGRLTSGGEPFRPSPALVALAWAPATNRRLPDEFPPEVKPDGRFTARFDAEALTLLVLDPEARRSGFAQLVGGETDRTLDMVPTAVYAGTLLGEDTRPLAGETLRLLVKTGGLTAVGLQKTDRAGRFRFPAVPAGVPLTLALGEGNTRPAYDLQDSDRLFTPGEVREGDALRPRPDPPEPAPRPAVPLADRLADARRDARSAGMRVLVVLKGDGSPGVANLSGRLLDTETTPAVLGYLPVTVEPAERKAEAPALDGFGWPAPGPGEVVLVALDGGPKAVGAGHVPTAGFAAGETFLKRHAPPARDALSALTSARDEARASGRRVWVVHGGPRCGPCFRLARWIGDHHATLEKDFVVVKVIEGIDVHAAEVIRGLPEAEGDGIPWHAFTEPDGTVLATSHGPLGNVGFPGTVEAARHFRTMLRRAARTLTPAEVDDLVDSLGPKP